MQFKHSQLNCAIPIEAQRSEVSVHFKVRFFDKQVSRFARKDLFLKINFSNPTKWS